MPLRNFQATLAALLVFFATGSHPLFAGSLRIDFNAGGSSDFPVYTQEDFDAFTLTAAATATNTLKYGTITLSVWPNGGNGLDDRRRTIVTNSVTFTNAPLLQDFIFNQGATNVGSGLSVRVQGLNSNQVYSFTVWSYDSASQGNRVSDWYANGILVTNNYSFNGSVLPNSNSSYRFIFTATANTNGEVLIEGKRDATSLDQNNAAATAVYLNGLELQNIPDQSPPCGTLEHFQPGSNLYGWTGGNTFEEQDQEVAALKEAGAQWVRVNVVWYAVEPNQKGVYDTWLLSMYDHLMARLAENGIKVIFVTADTPYWASADTNKYTDGTGQHWSQKYKPSNFNDLADYYVFLRNRYASTGPHVFEIWNEENHSSFWPSGVDATNYVSMLQTCYNAIKAADPEAIVLNGGLTDGSNTTNFMATMYAAGAKPYFDAWSQHTYQRTPQYETIVSKVRNIMVANGDAAKKVWMTEWGWVTYTNTADASAVSYDRQAHYLTNFFTRLASYPEVAVGLWYTSRSYDETTHEGSFGLQLPDFTKKPSFYGFKHWVAAANRHCFPYFINLSAPAFLPNGTPRIQFTADSQFSYALESSSNFSVWLPVATNLNSASGAFSVDDTAAPNSNSRFYRVKW